MVLRVVLYQELIGTQPLSHPAVYVQKIIMGMTVVSQVLFGLAIIRRAKKTGVYYGYDISDRT